jgi:general secretion pathway protein G
MKLRHPAETRPGFTLVEMMVVLAIIIVLVSLIAGAVLQFTKVGPQVQAQYEISHLNQAIENFKQKYGVYPPSKIFLANTTTDYQNAAAAYTKVGDSASAQVVSNSPAFLQRIFPKLDWTGASGTIDWTGGLGNQFKGAMLEGDQCLVFFLGGIQTSSGVKSCLGFAANAKNPTLMSGPRYDPLYEFPSTRLAFPILMTQNGNVQRTTPFGNKINPFFIYTDPYGTGMPYIYFSSYFSRNGYLNGNPLNNECPSLTSPGLNNAQTPPWSSPVVINPYFEAANPVRFLNPNTFQIITAGADGDFGPGGLWNPGQQPVDPFTRDNQSNFNNGGLMGTRN